MFCSVPNRHLKYIFLSPSAPDDPVEGGDICEEVGVRARQVEPLRIGRDDVQEAETPLEGEEGGVRAGGGEQGDFQSAVGAVQVW